MQIWQDEEEAAMEEHGGCCGLSAVDDARRVAAALDIPYYVMNFKKEFKENVIDYLSMIICMAERRTRVSPVTDM